VIVLDTSALVDYLIGGPPSAWVETQLRSASSVHVPHVVDVEVVGSLRKLVANRAVSDEVASEAISELEDLDLVRYGHLPFVEQMWSLRHNLSAADAAFVSLAEALAAPLVTTDLRLARAPGLPAEVVAPV